MLAAEATPSAGGAGIGEILIAGAMASTVMLIFGWIVLRERQGRPTFVGRLADRLGEVTGLPRWLPLPAVLTVVSLLTAAFGVWWDVPIHMQNGRDPGPLANPSHYPIFLGILGFLHAGVLSMGLSRDPLPRRTVALSRSWHVPMGSLVIFAAGVIALMGFPADDLWHRIYGQDVTEWGPTHVMMIGGAVTCGIGLPLLFAEAAQVGAKLPTTKVGRFVGVILIGLCIVPIGFLMEFDLGVPQYPAATQFILAGFLAGWVFVAARLWFGFGGAAIAGGLYLFIHGYIYAVTAPLPGVLSAKFLLFLPMALLVEVVALVLSPKKRPLPFAVVSGLLIGTVGLWIEWLWSDAFMPLPQPLPSSSLPLMLATGTGAALGGAVLATWFAARLVDVATPDDQVANLAPVGPGWRRNAAGLLGLATFVGLMAAFAPPAGGTAIPGTVTFSNIADAAGTPMTACDGIQECLATVTVQVEPADALDDAVWFYALAWQGRGPGGKADVPGDPATGAPGIMRIAMDATDVPGQYVSADPLPLYGHWKSMLRLHLAPRTMLALPLHAPDDPAIAGQQGREVLAHSGDHSTFQYEKKFLQRETKEDVPAWLNTVAYAAVMGSWIVLVLFFGWCYAAASTGRRTGRTAREKVPA